MPSFAIGLLVPHAEISFLWDRTNGTQGSFLHGSNGKHRNFKGFPLPVSYNYTRNCKVCQPAEKSFSPFPQIYFLYFPQIHFEK